MLKSDHHDIAYVEPKLEAKELVAESNAVSKEEKQVEFLEHEIECPRCQDNMALCSDFGSLYYVCEECDFCLFTIRKNSDARRNCRKLPISI